jgi:hypothetical protein
MSIFQARFINPIKKFLTVSPSSIVVFVPSVKDMITDHCVFPQPEFSGGVFDGIAGDPVRFSRYSCFLPQHMLTKEQRIENQVPT